MRKRRLLLTLIFIGLIAQGVTAQQSQSPNQTKKDRIEQINREMEDVDKSLESLNDRRSKLNEERTKLLLSITAEEEDDAFKSSPARVVRNVLDEQTVILLVNGSEKKVLLSGISIKLGSSVAAKDYLQQQLKGGLVYARCAGLTCDEVYLYVNREGPSLNAELVRLDHAIVLSNAAYDLKRYSPQSTATISSPSTGSSISSPSGSSSSSSSAGKDVHVKGYYRKDGTYVKPHTRSAPGSKKKP